MDSFRILSDSSGSRLMLLRRSAAAWLCFLILGLAPPVLAATQNPPSPQAEDVLDEGLRLGKLGPAAYQQLMTQFGAGQRVRIIVGLTSPDPFARLSGPQARSRATRLARRQAIARAQTGLMSRPGLQSLRGVKRFRNLPYIALEVDADELSRLTRQPEVSSIASDELLHLSLNDTAPQLGADAAWLQGFQGQGQVVAILDTGFDAGHPAFVGRLVDEACYSTTSLLDGSVSLCPNGDNPNGEDSQVGPGAAVACQGMLGCDHGTHVAGIAAGDDATFRGMAPAAGILPIQVFSQINNIFTCGFAPPCLSSYTSDVVRGLERVYEWRDTYPISVVNMSLGGETYTTAAACDAAYPAVKAAVDNLRSVGITTVVASGNQGDTNAIATPACVSSAVSVGAVDIFDTVAWFSNSADFLDTLSGGVGIISTVPGDTFDAKSGTSMAAPGVAGAVAVLRSADETASPDEIVDAIKTTGVPITDTRNGVVAPRAQIDAAADLLTDGDLSRVTLALVPELSGLTEPVGVTHAGDGSGRLFVMQRAGSVLVRDASGLLPIPLLDISAKVDCCAPDGLLGLAFHPNHGANGLVYVSYLTPFGEIVVERYTVSADPNQVDPDSGVEIIRIPSTLDGHHGGRLHFGPDGYLYVATGDGAPDGSVPLPGNSGDPGSLSGKILRIDVDAAVPYAVPPDNPLVGTAGAREEIWALGLRDPRRFSFDGMSGELYVADVGESLAHEVNVQPADSTGGEDYGWNVMEGSSCRAGQACDPTGLTLPVVEYDFTAGCAVTGGVVYRGASYADLWGAYVFGDLCSGRVWGLRQRDGAWQHELLTQAAVQITAFGSDEGGEAYLVDRAGGQVYRLVDSDLLIDTVRLSTASVDVPYADTFSASGGLPPYQWSIVEGTLPSGLGLDGATGAISGTPTAVGSSIFTVQVQDAEFATVSRVLRINVTPPPLVIDTLSLPEADTASVYSATLAASGGTPPYTWAVTGGALPAGITLSTDGALSGTPTEQGVFTFDATVTDAADEETTQSFSISVFGASIALQLNVPDPGAYGNGFGSNQHLLGLDATFIGTGLDLTLFVTGYDVDYADELLVSLNGNPIGYLTVGSDAQLNGGDHFVIPATAQLPGENVIRFKVKTPNWIWGVTDLLLTDAPPPLEITTTALPDATFAQPYSATLAATGGRDPFTWSLAAGTLPAGLTLNADGTLTGTPTEQGSFDFTARVTDSLGTTTDQAFNIRAVGASGNIEVMLALNVPDPGQYGNGYGSNEHPTELYANFTGVGSDLTLHVTGYDVDYPDELLVSLNGNPLGYLSAGPDGALNAGDAFAIPAAMQLPGTNQIHFQVKTAGWIWGVTGLLLVEAPLEISATTLPDATFAQAYAASLQATGGRTPYTWSMLSGALPAGLTLNADGTLTGTPAEQGAFDFTARVTDGLGATADRAFNIRAVGASGTIEVMLALNVPDTGQYGNGYGSNEHYTDLYATFTGAGSDLVLQVTGYDVDYADETLVSLNGNPIGYLSVGPDSGLNAGDSFFIPASSQLPGANQLRFQVKTAGWIWGVTNLLLGEAPLEITTTTLADGTFEDAYSAALAATGGRAPYSWSLAAGSLPGGITLNADGTLTGTPTEQGAFDFTARVTDSLANTADQPLNLGVVGPSGTLEVMLALNVPDTGQYGNGYGSNEHYTDLYANFTGTGTDLVLQVTGYDVDYADETLVSLNGNPIGYLSVGPNNALNAGDSFVIPAASQLPGANQIHFQVKTAGWIWGVTNLLLGDPPLEIDTTALADAVYAEAYSTTLEASGGHAPYSWSLAAGALPAGLALNADGTLSGTATEQGLFSFTARVTDSLGATADQPLSLRAVGASGTIELVLQINVADTGEYGNGYGSNEHYTELFANFIGTTNDLTLHVTGYDVDYADELSVSLNGNPLGYLSAGPNNDLNGGDSFVIPLTAQLPGANQIRFQVKTAGWIWGVTNLLLSDAPLPLNITTATLNDATYAGAYTATLEATGGRRPYTWSLASGALPAGLTLNSDGTVTGTPNEQGTFAFTARLTDDLGTVKEQALEIQAVGTSGTVEVVLTPGTMDTGAYGKGYGSNEHYAELYATFIDTGTDLTFYVTGYDVDYGDELLVSLNGNPLGYLSAGPDGGLNAGDTFVIPAASQVPGANLIHFQVKTPGWIWGVTNLLLE